MTAKIEVQDAQKIQQLKQHYHELIEAENKKFIENEKAQERLQKDVRVTLK